LKLTAAISNYLEDADQKPEIAMTTQTKSTYQKKSVVNIVKIPVTNPKLSI